MSGDEMTTKPTVLIVDDDAGVRQVLRSGLEDDYYVFEAADGHYAISEILLADKPFDVLVTDLNMPESDGIDLIDRLPEHVPYIIMSGYLDVPEYQKALARLEPAAVLRKPFSVPELREAIEASIHTDSDSSPTARILIIDDDQDVRSPIRQMLAGAGYEVQEASDGDEGLEMCREDPPDLTIVDIFMPRKSGVEVIQELRSAYPEAKIIVISGGDVRDGLDLQTLVRPYGVQQAIQKPLRIQSVFDAVDRILEQP